MHTGVSENRFLANASTILLPCLNPTNLISPLQFLEEDLYIFPLLLPLWRTSVLCHFLLSIGHFIAILNLRCNFYSDDTNYELLCSSSPPAFLLCPALWSVGAIYRINPLLESKVQTLQGFLFLFFSSFHFVIGQPEIRWKSWFSLTFDM